MAWSLTAGITAAVVLGVGLATLAADATGAVVGPPINLTATANGSTVTLTWTAPTSGDPVTGYMIEAGSIRGAANRAIVPTGNTSTVFSASGVGAGTYFLRVRALGAAGVGPPSNEVELIVGGGPCVSPGAPRALAVASVNGGTVGLTWSAASGTPTSYSVEAGSGSGLANLANIDLGGPATSVTATSVAPGTYYVRIRARTACGVSTASNEVILAVGPGVTTLTRLDEQDGWGVFVEGTPTSALERVGAPSLDGSSLRCGLTGGVPYSNVHCYLNLPGAPAATYFQLDLHFYYRPLTTFNNEGQPSVVQGIEFTTSQWTQGRRYELALQLQNVGTGAPQWRHWNPAAPERWLPTGVPAPVRLAGEQWHSLSLLGEVVNGQVHYSQFIVDGAAYPLSITVPPIDDPGTADKIAVGVQLDGNFNNAPYDVFVDRVTLTYR